MGRAKDANKPKGRMSAYAFFIQTCREEHKKKHPGESVNFSEFSKKCSEKWRTMGPKDKKRFEDMSAKDKARYDKDMSTYVPAAGDAKGKRKKKDPNAPKRPLSSFFFFCNDERSKVRAVHPEWGVGDVAKELGKKWEVCTCRPKYEEMNAKAKIKYEKEMTAYKNKTTGGASSPKKAKKAPEPEEEEDEEEEEDDEEEDDE